AARGGTRPSPAGRAAPLVRATPRAARRDRRLARALPPPRPNAVALITPALLPPILEAWGGLCRLYRHLVTPATPRSAGWEALTASTRVSQKVLAAGHAIVSAMTTTLTQPPVAPAVPNWRAWPPQYPLRPAPAVPNWRAWPPQYPLRPAPAVPNWRALPPQKPPPPAPAPPSPGLPLSRVAASPLFGAAAGAQVFCAAFPAAPV